MWGFKSCFQAGFWADLPCTPAHSHTSGSTLDSTYSRMTCVLESDSECETWSVFVWNCSIKITNVSFKMWWPLKMGEYLINSPGVASKGLGASVIFVATVNPKPWGLESHLQDLQMCKWGQLSSLRRNQQAQPTDSGLSSEVNTAASRKSCTVKIKGKCGPRGEIRCKNETKIIKKGKKTLENRCFFKKKYWFFGNFTSYTSILLTSQSPHSLPLSASVVPQKKFKKKSKQIKARTKQTNQQTKKLLCFFLPASSTSLHCSGAVCTQ